jgi:hypothetical protein
LAHALRTRVASTGRKVRRVTVWLLLLVLLLVTGPLLTLAFGRASLHGDWRSATHRSAGLAPDAGSHREAIVQVYASRTFGWRGAFADHTWLAAKPAGAEHYLRYEVIGWYSGGGRSVISVSDRQAPDAEWYGTTPRLIQNLHGREAEAVIARLPGAIATYPFGTTYRAWPGPNSNTFVAHLGREIPDLRLTMPSTAIGKDFVPLDQMVGWTPSHTGVQWSLYGLLGVLAGWDEGLEVNLFGLVTGFDVRHPALKLPGIGRVPGEG